MDKAIDILNKPNLILSIISFFGVYWIFFQFNYDNPNSIAGDGVGYYQYLPNTFINKNIDNQVPDGRFIQEIKGKGVNKYYIGTTVSMSPFFILGHGIAHLVGEKKDGFSYPYHWTISFAGLLFLIGGLYFFIRFLKLFQFSNTVISVSLLLMIFGTNLFAYAFLMPSMSHVYSFFWITGFLFFVKTYFKSNSKNQLYLGVLFFSMLLLVRPINGIVILVIPFLFQSFLDFKKSFSGILKPERLFVSILILTVILFIQPLFWYLQTGSWLVWSYGNEGFNFTNPQWIEFLFGFRKGALIYTPILLLSIAGLGILISKNKFSGIGLLLFFGLLIYTLSSWWNWYYGPSFSQRPLVEFYGLSFLLVAYFIRAIQSLKSKIFISIIAGFFVFLNLIQTYQYQKRIISSWDMTWEKYKYTLLKTGGQYQLSLGGNNDILPYNPIIDTVFSKQIKPSRIENVLEVGKAFSQGNSEIISYKDLEFNFSLTVPCSPKFITKRGIYILTEMNIMDFNISHKNEALLVVDISDSLGNSYHYTTFPIRSIPPKQKETWKKENYSIEIQQLKNQTDRIKIYVWNKSKEDFWLKDLKIDVLTIR